MKKIIILLVLISSFTSYNYSQSNSIKGYIIDTITKQKLSDVSISLLNASDSFLVAHTRTLIDGSFELKNVARGKYILMCTYPLYTDYTDKLDFTIKPDSVINIGYINMVQIAHLLQNVIVTQKTSAIRIKGDTTEFAADSFHVQPNATVEDLIKKLPGLQVDKNGNITANGQKVKKVLVDGEEFFGDDPTLVTKNLSANMIDKVQLYDKKSDQAAFTGIDDGKKEKTINLKLKENKKNGFFGKVDGGIGTDKYYQEQAMFNSFKGKRKFALYGIAVNTGQVGLNSSDQNGYTGNDNISINEDGVSILTIDNSNKLDSWNGKYDGEGIPNVLSGGVHYDNKWNDDKQTINGNYKVGRLNVIGENNTITQNNLPNTIIYSTSKQKFNNSLFRNKVSATSEVQLDSNSSVKISADGQIIHKTTLNDYITESKREDQSLLNSSQRNISTSGDNNVLNGNVLWRKKFKKKGRTVSLNLKENLNKDNFTGYLNSANSFYSKINEMDSSEIIHQFKTNNITSSLFNSKLTYTEPINKLSSVTINYGIIVNNSNSTKNSYNKSADGHFTDLDSLYSNHYQYNQFIHRTGLGYNYKKGKWRIQFGNDVGLANFIQTNLYNNSILKRKFINWYPQAGFAYQFSSVKMLTLKYNGNTTQPSITQLQPVLINDDPLNIYAGNPDLKPSFEHNLDLFYSDYKVLTERTLMITSGYNLIHNPIVTNVQTDTVGKSTYQYSNISGANNSAYYAYLFYAKPLKKLKLNSSFEAQFGMYKYFNFSNNQKNITNSNNYSLSGNLSKSKEKIYEIGIQVKAIYYTNNSSLQKEINNNYWSYNFIPALDIFLLKKVHIHSDVDYNWQQKTTIFNQDISRFLWNAWVTRSFTKKDNLLVKLSGNDLLNQNIGFNRSTFNNMMIQNRYTTIRRYFMFSVIWNFNKTNGDDIKK